MRVLIGSWAGLGAGILGACLATATVRAPAAKPLAGAVADPVSVGQMLYRDGLVGPNRPVRARRDDGIAVEGSAVACLNCHRRSGLGNVEGNIVVPPITAKYLFRSIDANAGDLQMAHVEGYHQEHPAFDDASLARAIRQGVLPGGRRLNALMPRYELDDASMAQLIGYLRGLSHDHVPGVSDTTLQFATIVTPDADPIERQAMLDVLERFFSAQREVIAAEVRPMRASREIQYRVTRQWDLHVWELTGPPDGWERQLHDRMRNEPVFAVISGIGRRTWAPVHRFCEREQVPCLFPNIDLPVVSEKDFYPVYFSRGVLLEADLIASTLHESGPSGMRVIQLFRRDDIGEDAASALHARLQADGVDVQERALAAASAAGDLAQQLRDLTPADAVVLWLRPQDLASLPPRAPPAAKIVMSGLMGGLEAAPLPRQWRTRAQLSYPIDLPERRLARMNFPYGWLKVRNLPITAERVQVNTYLACVITSETLGHMFDSFVPEYLLERLEMMASRRLANAYFPRLGLAPEQRFASKGGYIVHFDATAAPVVLPATANPAAPRGQRVIADTDWIVP